MKSRADAWWPWAIALPAGCLFAGFLAWPGVPALRHDWVWVTGPGFVSNAWSSLGGWTAIGIGSPRPYPTDYLPAMLNMALVSAIGTFGAFLVNVFAVGAACAAGGVALARRFTGVKAAWIAAAAFAAFNPWVYNKVVAGHLGMVLAYGATMLAIAEFSKPRPSAFAVGAYAVLTMQQLQFFLPLLAVLGIWTLVRRQSALPLGVALLASMPIWIGVLFDRSYLLSIPYTQAWQADASVDPLRALALGGYFVNYAETLPPVAGAACWVVAGLALAGAVVECIRRRLRAGWIVALGLALWLFASGTKGPFGPGYLWIVAHVPESGLYRELYDLIGFLAIAYVAASAAAVRWVKPLQWVWLACGALLIASWSFAPPFDYWVAASELPVHPVALAGNARYALMPPVQPILYQHRGNGLDPGAVVLPGNVVPLNTPQFSFPETPALAQYALTGDARWLRALSVAQVIERPEFASDLNSLHMQFALAPHAFRSDAPGTALDAAPELALMDVPSLDPLPAPPWEDSVFFGDARGVDGPDVPAQWRDAPAVVRVRPSSSGVFAAAGWVDVRTAFAVLPQLAQGLGGAITTNGAALLPLDPSLQTLAYVDGHLQSADGAMLAASTHGYRWLQPLGVGAVRCAGLCVIAAQSAGPPAPAASSGSGCASAIAFSAPAAWLAIADLPASGTCLLRYNVRFDEHWTAFLTSTPLGHVAVDSIVNGWVVPAHARTQRVILIESVACAQFAFMLIAVAVLLAAGAARGYALVKR